VSSATGGHWSDQLAGLGGGGGGGRKGDGWESKMIGQWPSINEFSWPLSETTSGNKVAEQA
jgi:hypothetical protein